MKNENKAMQNSDTTDNAAQTPTGPNSELTYTETPQKPKGKGGRPKYPNAKVLVSVRLRPDQLAFLERFAVEGDETNVALQIETFVDMAKAFVARPDYERERGDGGRFVGAKPAPVRPTRPQLAARIKALEARLRAAGLETE